MSTNRATLYAKIHKVLKKHYEPATPVERTVLEHLLHGLCLENSRHDAADEALAKLQLYADWNEVRVTSVSELTEVVSMLNHPGDAARRLKRALQSIFETRYSFDLEFLKKANLGKAIKDLELLQGVTPFAVAYVSQHGLGGHAIPANSGVFGVLAALGAISESEASDHRTPGMERAIPKTKGIEFASLIHQLGVDFEGPPQPKIKAILLEIHPGVEYPRREKKTEPPAAPPKGKGGDRKMSKSAPQGKSGATGSTSKEESPPKEPRTKIGEPDALKVRTRADVAKLGQPQTGQTKPGTGRGIAKIGAAKTAPKKTDAAKAETGKAPTDRPAPEKGAIEKATGEKRSGDKTHKANQDVAKPSTGPARTPSAKPSSKSTRATAKPITKKKPK